MRKYLILFLFAGILLSCNASKQSVTVVVSNNSEIDRDHEMVEIPWSAITAKLGSSVDGDKIVVTEKSSTSQIPYQILKEDTDKFTKLIFPASVDGGKELTFQIKSGTPEEYEPLVYGRFVPERKDDFTWENNRSAFRIYGPALEATGEISNGMDYWAKKTESLVIDKWYKDDLAGIASYHQDHGEGVDFYKVGRTLGLGMTAPFHNDTLCLGNNFTEYKVLDNGPLRIAIQFKYKPYMAGEREIYEIRTISLDAYSYMNKIQNVFNSDDQNSQMHVATGLVMQKDSDKTFVESENGIIAYEVPEDKRFGTLFSGAINPNGFMDTMTSQGHLLGINEYKIGSKYIYYTGGGWTKDAFKTFDEWTDFLKVEEAKLQQPLELEIK